MTQPLRQKKMEQGQCTWNRKQNNASEFVEDFNCSRPENYYIVHSGICHEEHWCWLLIDLENQSSFIGYAHQDNDGLFYISYNQDSIPVNWSARAEKIEKPMMDSLCNHFALSATSKTDSKNSDSSDDSGEWTDTENES